MKKRSHEPELMDLGSQFYTIEEYRDCLKQLGRIGKYLGGDRATLQAFKSLPYAFDSVLDVGCGGGIFTLRLAQMFPKARIVGIDIAHEAISYAQERLHEVSANNIKFLLRTDPQLNEPPKSYDIVTATLVCHHFNDDMLIDFLKRARNVARKAIILNDLHRHWLAYVSFAGIGPLFFRNRLVQYDSLLSIKKAFTRKDWIEYLTRAGFSSGHYKIVWKWPFRWIITVDVR